MIEKPVCPRHGRKFMGKGGSGNRSYRWYECHPGKNDSCNYRVQVWASGSSERGPRKTGKSPRIIDRFRPIALWENRFSSFRDRNL